MRHCALVGIKHQPLLSPWGVTGGTREKGCIGKKPSPVTPFPYQPLYITSTKRLTKPEKILTASTVATLWERLTTWHFPAQETSSNGSVSMSFKLRTSVMEMSSPLISFPPSEPELTRRQSFGNTSFHPIIPGIGDHSDHRSSTPAIAFHYKLHSSAAKIFPSSSSGLGRCYLSSLSFTLLGSAHSNFRS